MLIDRTHRGWIGFTLVALIAATAYYTVYHKQSYELGGSGPSGGSWTGLTYGIIGFAMMIFCGLLGVRRKVRIWKIGKGQAWLRAHIWLGLLAYPLILFHAGMRFGYNLTFILMVLFTIVLVSGIAGVILQNLIPRSLLTRVPAESTFEQIPNVIEKLRREANRMVRNVSGPLGNESKEELDDEQALLAAAAGQKKDARGHARLGGIHKTAGADVPGAEPLKNFYVSEIQPFLTPQFDTANPLATERSAIAVFEHAKTLLPDALHEVLRDLMTICDERRQLALQSRLHFWLHSWEFIHVPLSYALLGLSVVHAILAVINY